MNAIQDNHLEGLVTKIANDPQTVAPWESLLKYYSRKSDFESIGSVEVILGGLRALPHSDDGERSENLSEVLSKLAGSPNDAALMKELGVVYLNEFKLFSIAGNHFERAKGLACKDADLDGLLKEARVPQNGVTEARNGTNVAKAVFRKTAQLALLKRDRNEVEEFLEEQEEQPEREPLLIPEDSAECLTQAREALQQEDLDSAFQLLEAVPASSEFKVSLWDAWTDLGAAYFDNHDFFRAEPCYGKACEIGPKLMVSHFNWGTALQMTLQLDQALDQYFAADALEPDNPKVWCNIASVCFLQNNLGGSKAALVKALEIYPEYARAWNNLASTLGAQGNMEEARAACLKTLELTPNVPDAKFKLGIIHFIQNRWIEALPMFLETVSDPTLSGFAYAYLSMTFSQLGNVLSARRALTAATQLVNDPELLAEVWSNLGYSYLRSNETEEARQAHVEAIRLSPDNPDCWTGLAMVHQALQEYQESKYCFQRATDCQLAMAAVA